MIESDRYHCWFEARGHGMPCVQEDKDRGLPGWAGRRAGWAGGRGGWTGRRALRVASREDTTQARASASSVLPFLLAC